MNHRLWWTFNRARLALLHGDAVAVGPAHPPRVALTFDDGPDPAATPAILDALERAGARATFFFLAPHIEAHPDLARRVAATHEIGTHLYAHDRARVASRAAFDDEVRRSLEVHERILGQRPTALRFPFGDPGRVRPTDARAHGLTPYHWTFSSEDASATAPDPIIDHVTPRLHAGAIILFHDGRGPNSRKGCGPRGATVAALPRVLSAVAERGLRATTLRDLFAGGGDAS